MFCLLILYMGLFILTFNFILPYLCQDWIHSIYFYGDPSSIERVKTALEISAKRYSLAKQYLSSAQAPNSFKRTKSLKLVICIVTTRRSPEKDLGITYLTQVSAAAHTAVTSDNMTSTTDIFICNVDNDAHKHTEAILLKKHFTVVAEYYGKKINEELLHNNYEKAKMDYIYCLNEAINRNSSGILMLEDDALLRPDTFKVLKYIINTKLKQVLPVRSGTEQGYILKLYHPEKWQGFSSNFVSFAELLSVGVCISALCSAFHWLCQAVLLIHTRHAFVNCKLPINACIIYFVYGIFVAASTGRPYLLELRRSHEQLYTLKRSFDCCIPAMYYPNHTAILLRDYLSTVTSDADWPVDVAVGSFSTHSGIQGFTVEPNLVTHIGMISSIAQNDKPAAEFIFV